MLFTRLESILTHHLKSPGIDGSSMRKLSLGDHELEFVGCVLARNRPDIRSGS
jgi:hypothetical protein